MDWLTQIVVFGLSALAFFTLSISLISAKKPGIGLGFAELELFSAVVSSLAWMDALKESGKIDWFLLGVLSYPPVGLIFVSMFAVGLLCVLASSRELIRRGDVANPAT